MSTIIAPEVDMLTVSKNSRIQRRAILGFAPRIGLSIVDYGDLDKVDNFYLDCQNYRDYYRDPYFKLHRPERFRYHQGRCGIKLDRSVEQLMAPTVWVTEPQPVVYPAEYGHAIQFDKGIQLVGRYNKSSNITFKR